MTRNRRGFRYPGEELEAAKKQADAMQLRAQGWSYAKIGAHLGVTGMQAHRLVKKGLAKTIQEPAEELRKMELDRLDELFVNVFRKATDPLKADPKAVELTLKIMERRSKLLGLDMPIKAQIQTDATVNVTGGVQIYIPDNQRDKPN